MKNAFFISIIYPLLAMCLVQTIETFYAFIFILISCSPLLISWKSEIENFSHLRLNSIQWPSNKIFLGLTIISIFNIIVAAITSGVSLADLLSYDGVYKASQTLTLKRYHEGGASGNPILLGMSLFLVYRCSISNINYSRIGSIVSLLSIFLYGLLTTEKYPIFLAISFHLFGILSISYPAFFSKRLLNEGIFLIFIGIIAAIVSLFLRHGGQADQKVYNTLLHYILGQDHALGAWIISGWGECCEYGALTFIGPLSYLNFIQRPEGVFLTNVHVVGEDTNIYTAWRYLAEDFSLFGPFVISLVFSSIFVLSNYMEYFTISRLIALFLMFSSLISLNVTPFVHNSTALALLGALVYNYLILESNIKVNKIDGISK